MGKLGCCDDRGNSLGLEWDWLTMAEYLACPSYPEGIEYVLVNGTMVIEQGEHSGRSAGRVLYREGGGV